MVVLKVVANSSMYVVAVDKNTYLAVTAGTDIDME
jgi:hypothetical protein